MQFTEQKHTGQSTVLDVSTGETLTAQVGLDMDGAFQRVMCSYSIQANVYPAILTPPAAPFHLAPCPKHTDHLDQSKESLTGPQAEQREQVPAGRVIPSRDLQMERSRLVGHVDVLGL